MKKFIETILNIYNIEELRGRIITTLTLLLVYRLGAQVVLPGIDSVQLSELSNRTDGGGLLGILNAFTGGAFANASVFALGIMPYISASIVVQLMGIAVPYLQKLQKEGESGNKKRTLCTSIPSNFQSPFAGLAKMVMDGVVALDIGNWESREKAREEGDKLSKELKGTEGLGLVVLTEDPSFCAETIANFLWLTFTRSDPAADIYGLNSSSLDKHWNCEAPMIIDARIKSHHAPVLTEDDQVALRADEIVKKYLP